MDLTKVCTHLAELVLITDSHYSCEVGFTWVLYQLQVRGNWHNQLFVLTWYNQLLALTCHNWSFLNYCLATAGYLYWLDTTSMFVLTWHHQHVCTDLTPPVACTDLSQPDACTDFTQWVVDSKQVVVLYLLVATSCLYWLDTTSCMYWLRQAVVLCLLVTTSCLDYY